MLPIIGTLAVLLLALIAIGHATFNYISRRLLEEALAEPPAWLMHGLRPHDIQPIGRLIEAARRMSDVAYHEVYQYDSDPPPEIRELDEALAAFASPPAIVKLYGPVYSYKPSAPAMSEAEGLKKLRKLAQEHPELFIVGARDLTVPRKKPLWKRFLTGE